MIEQELYPKCAFEPECHVTDCEAASEGRCPYVVFRAQVHEELFRQVGDQ